MARQDGPGGARRRVRGGTRRCVVEQDGAWWNKTVRGGGKAVVVGQDDVCVTGQDGACVVR